MSLGIQNPARVRASRLLLYVFTVGFIAFLVWASLFEIDQTIRARGQIIAADRTQTVQSPESGVIESIKVREGDVVKKGDVLVVLERDRANAGYTDARNKVAALKIALVRLKAEVYGRKLSFPPDLTPYQEFIQNQTDLYKRRKMAIDEEVQALGKSLGLAREELNMNIPLLQTGDVGRAEVLRLRRQVADIEGQITNRKNKYFQDAQAEMTKVQEELSTQEQNYLDKRQLLEHTVLSASADGIVKNVVITTVGGVVRQGDEVMQILPTNSDLIVEAKIQPIDMSELKTGLPALIKLDAYDYSIYGAMKGEIEYISPDTLAERTPQGEMTYYRAKIRIKENEFKQRFADSIEVTPGMTTTVDIRTGRRSVLLYLTKPITKTLSESMSEK